MPEQSVKDLRSRFEQIDVQAKPLGARKPVIAPKLAYEGPAASKTTKVDTGDVLVDGIHEHRSVENPSSAADPDDPFSSPTNSPTLVGGFPPTSIIHKPMRSPVPRHAISLSSPGDRGHDATKLQPGFSTSASSRNSQDMPRPVGIRPPPPPSPRLKSPVPVRRSVELPRPSATIAKGLFLEKSNDSSEERLDIHPGSAVADRNSSTPDHVPADYHISRSAAQSRGNSRIAPAHNEPQKSRTMDTEPLHSGSLAQDRQQVSAFTLKSASLLAVPLTTSPAPEFLKPALPIRPSSAQLQPSAEIFATGHKSDEHPELRPRLPQRPESNAMRSQAPLKATTSQAPCLPARLHEATVGDCEINRVRGGFPSPGDDGHPVAAVSQQSAQVGHKGSVKEEPQKIEDSDGDEESTDATERARILDQPDASNANRKPPRFKGSHWDLLTGKEIRKASLVGDLVMIAHNDKLRLHNLISGEAIWQVALGDAKVTAMDFRTVSPENIADAGRFLWVGFKDGTLHEYDIRNRAVVERYFHAHPCAITHILRCGQAMWTLDEAGNLYLWGQARAISLKGRPAATCIRTVAGHSAAVVVRGCLWLAAARTIHVFDPRQSSEYRLTGEKGLEPTRTTGNVTTACFLPHTPDHVYFGHDDGKISIYSISSLKCIEILSISHYNVSSLLSVGDYLWTSFKTGKIFIYDVHRKPWKVMKEWSAHKSPVQELSFDRYSLWLGKRSQVGSIAGDGSLKVWDGLMMEDWLDAQMQSRLRDFSTFDTISALLCTWNAGASVPQKLSRDYEDSVFIEDMIKQADSPDIIVFGFQELVDLDDKGKAGRSVAKGFFGTGKKKEKENVERTPAFAYREWQKHLEKQMQIISQGHEHYELLQVRDLIGLFSCIFIKQKLHKRVGNIQATSIKTGLKGRYGNKGGIVIRFTLDDTSMCFVNCHLAAGQKHVMGRNNDVFAILDQADLPSADDVQVKKNVFVCGGDGSKVLDHEICVLSGDLNYRINGNRNQILRLIKEKNIPKLLENDQLLLELRKNATHRLRSFQESPIEFPPTYKFDPGTDNYDSSEKLRVPAWCDRIFYRGLGASAIQASSYQSHVCRVSDHRPVSAVLSTEVKTVDQKLRTAVYESVANLWIDLAHKTIVARKLAVLMEITGRSERECKEALRGAAGLDVHHATLALISSSGH